MPGRKELELFREELSKIGREREVTEERGEVYEAPPLPGELATSDPGLDVDNLLASIDGEVAPAATEDDYAMDAMLASLGLSATTQTDIPPETVQSEPVEAEPVEADSIEAEPVEADSFQADIEPLAEFDSILEDLPLDDAPAGFSLDEGGEDSFVVPENLLAGFADDIEESRSQTDAIVDDLPEIEEVPEVSDIPEIPDLTEISDFSDLGDIPEAETLSNEANEAPADPIAGLDALLSKGLPELDDISFDTPGGDTAPNLADMEIPPPPAYEEETDITPSFEMDLTPGRSDAVEPMANSFGDDFSDFSIPDDLSISESESVEPAVADGFDGFSLDEDFLKAGASDASDDEFHIPGFSDFTSSSARASLSEFPSGEGGVARKGGKKEVPLKISEEDFSRFLDLLSHMPLNVRIAAEEYLAGDSGSELQKMEFVHSVLIGTSVRKLARVLEGYLDRTIPVPKDFEKKSVAEYEEEKTSLRYVLINKILPAAIMFTVIALLTACTVFLSWNFIWRPLAAESLYKRGYTAIQDARYTQSMDFFNQAVRVWEKKKWYFRYARAYRDQKQYLSAEAMYERLLNRYKNDLPAGLEYAEMLRTDLRNFEKAETVLRRRVLDYHVNNQEGLMLLGDNFLDWADEDPSKYPLARQAYATLIELYGSKDPFLARMMRYFIRTDNLAEVLPLKEHFTGRKAKIDASDLVELSGYLLEKRYTPKPGESEGLRAQIEDLRSLLERAVKADPEVPEAHYNMGRFFLFNYKDDLASTAFEESLRLFDQARTMSPRRILTHIDSYRLLGEIRSSEKEYLKAQALLGEGISLYEKQRENRGVRPDPLVGKLYSDYADIDYFISNDLERSLENYQKAVTELNDTPSIRYRIGYIHYRNQDWESAMESFSLSYARAPLDVNLAYSFGNTLFRKGNLYLAQGHYERLMEKLEAEKIRKGIVFPQTRVDHGSFVQQYMRAANNLGVTLNRLAVRTGDSRKNARAMTLLSESTRAWDALTRNPTTMLRTQDKNLALANITYATHPLPDFSPEIYADIPKTLDGEPILQQREDR